MPYRSGHGSGRRVDPEKRGIAIGLVAAAAGSRVGRRSALWRGHHRVDRLAMDILARRTPESHPDSAPGDPAKPSQS